jgi:predicted  nucleic acid-binding Zn-ribbon protein
MIAKCPCEHCGVNIEFATEEFLSGSSVPCPSCGKETPLYVSPQAKPAPKPAAPPPFPKVEKPAQKFSAERFVWIFVALFIVIAAFAAYKWERKNIKNFDKRMDEMAKENAESIGNPAQAEKDVKADGIAKAKEFDALIPGLQDSEKNGNGKKPAFPPPPTSGMEFSANILNDFPERVEGPPGTLEGKFGWLDGEFGDIENLEFDLYYLNFDARTMVCFTVYDKNGNSFRRCYAEKSKFGDLLLGLKTFDRIRISGQAMMARQLNTDATFDIFLRIDSIQVIK